MSMKKAVSLLLIAALLCAGAALADTAVGTTMRVVNCQSFVTLREDADTKSAAITTIPLNGTVVCLRDEGRFCHVHYAGESGYVLSEYLRAEDDGGYTGVTPDAAQSYGINLFLSNFTESNLVYLSRGAFDLDTAADAVLVEFAVDHIWYNQHDKIETGDYFDDNNTRLSAAYVNPVLEKYFGVRVNDPTPLYLDYADGYYYWYETGGHISNGFAAQKACYDLGNGEYRVYFEVFGRGEAWENDVCGLTPDEARARYPDDVHMGCAVIRAGDLSDRATFTLRSIAVD